MSFSRKRKVSTNSKVFHSADVVVDVNLDIDFASRPPVAFLTQQFCY